VASWRAVPVLGLFCRVDVSGDRHEFLFLYNGSRLASEVTGQSSAVPCPVYLWSVFQVYSGSDARGVLDAVRGGGMEWGNVPWRLGWVGSVPGHTAGRTSVQLPSSSSFWQLLEQHEIKRFLGNAIKIKWCIMPCNLS
jgi:hypothetical protein